MGNPTSYLRKTLTWEGKQLTQLSMTIAGANVSLNYDYDENGLRMQKQYSVFGATNTMSYYYNGSVLIGMETEQGAIMRFSYDAGGNVGSVDYSDDYGDTFTTYYYLRNAQGDIVKLIDGSGNTVVEYTYDSWGRIIATTGSLATTLGANQPFRYRGYVYDEETGWYYLQSRYYDPTTCRFISADVLLSTGQGVIGHNSFAYCRNNPVGRRDRNGKEDEEIWPDYTQEVLDLLISNYNEAQAWSLLPVYAQINFYNHVRSKGEWDYKYSVPSWMPDDNKISFCGINMTAADLGNLNYGMTGMVCGFSRRTLLTAAGAVAIIEDGDDDGFLYYYDGADDYSFINLGASIAEDLNPAYAVKSAAFDLIFNMSFTGRKFLTIIKKARKISKLLPSNMILLALPY